MALTAMRYKTYIWPHNPRVYSIDYERQTAVNKVPGGRYQICDLGLGARVMRGEGEFVGEGAYEEFKKLATVFYSDGPGELIHPIWTATSVYFTALSLAQEPRPDYVRYTFEFTEDYGYYDLTLRQVTAAETSDQAGGQTVTTASAGTSSAAVYHTVVKGETLWAIAVRYGVTPDSVLALNGDIKNPNLIYVGQKVRVK